jgi:hypothetical protein
MGNTILDQVSFEVVPIAIKAKPTPRMVDPSTKFWEIFMSIESLIYYLKLFILKRALNLF